MQDSMQLSTQAAMDNGMPQAACQDDSQAMQLDSSPDCPDPASEAFVCQAAASGQEVCRTQLQDRAGPMQCCSPPGLAAVTGTLGTVYCLDTLPLIHLDNGTRQAVSKDLTSKSAPEQLVKWYQSMLVT